MALKLPKPQSGDLHAWLTFAIALSGMLIVFGALLLAVLVFQDAKNPASTIVAVVGTVTGVVGTLAGYVAGQAAGAAGKEQAEARAAKMGTVVGAAGDNAIDKARELFPEWFQAATPETSSPPGEHSGN